MQAMEMPNTHLSGSGEQFSMPKSLTSQLDRITVKRVSWRPLNCYKLTRSKGRQVWKRATEAENGGRLFESKEGEEYNLLASMVAMLIKETQPPGRSSYRYMTI